MGDYRTHEIFLNGESVAFYRFEPFEGIDVISEFLADNPQYSLDDGEWSDRYFSSWDD